LLIKVGLQGIGELLRPRLKLAQEFHLLPTSNADEHRYEQSEAKNHRNGHVPYTLPPQSSRLSGEHKNQRQGDENAERVADPPTKPIDGNVAGPQYAQCPHAADRNSCAREAKARREQ
jgi:hypothetical protein